VHIYVSHLHCIGTTVKVNLLELQLVLILVVLFLVYKSIGYFELSVNTWFSSFILHILVFFK